MIDRQKVYNRVRKHLLKQNEKALRESFGVENSCAYRAYDPNRKKVLKCAVGCLVPFRHYSPSIEGFGIWADGLQETLVECLPGFEGEQGDSRFLELLQDIHDSQDVDVWELRLDQFAVDHGLKVQA